MAAYVARFLSGKFRIKRDYWNMHLVDRFELPVEDTGRSHWLRGDAKFHKEVLQSTRAAYSEVFGIGVKEQLAIEDSILRGSVDCLCELVPEYWEGWNYVQREQ